MTYVLFVCTHNAGRSQMAQAFFEQMAPADVRAESAGTDPRPEIWPEVVQVMGEVGIELGDRRPKRLDVEMQRHADCLSRARDLLPRTGRLIRRQHPTPSLAHREIPR